MYQGNVNPPKEVGSEWTLKEGIKGRKLKWFEGFLNWFPRPSLNPCNLQKCLIQKVVQPPILEGIKKINP